MFRALLELFFIIIAIVVARSVLTSIFKGFMSASSGAFRADSSARPASPPSGSSQLHKDPVCGTYVTESTPFSREATGQTFYYCSEACREKHALVVR